MKGCHLFLVGVAFADHVSATLGRSHKDGSLCFIADVAAPRNIKRTRPAWRNTATIDTRPFGLLSHWTTSTERNLFFKAREESKRKPAQRQPRIPDYVFLELSQGNVELPFQFRLSEQGDEDSVVIVRELKEHDLTTIVPMCVDEFGEQVTISDLLKNFPWQEPLKATTHVQDWWGNFILPYFIFLTFFLKTNVLRDTQDHALLVATLHKDFDTSPNTIGMVELSKQPADPQRNPSAYPMPLWYKEWYCRLKKLPPPNGWVTNLLIAPAFRGQRYSKLLMMAAEGRARRWGCTAIHLHCDADTVGGKVPQNLYKGLGYEMVENENSPYSWMGSEFANNIYWIQGLALLYFRKVLADN